MGGVLAAYLTTVGIQFYRWWTKAHTVPPPVGLFGAAGVFGACALLARADNRLGGVTAWGITTAVYLAPYNAAVSKVAPAPPPLGAAAAEGPSRTVSVDVTPAPKTK